MLYFITARTSDIVQVGAVCGQQTFTMYIMPIQPIQPGVTQVTGIRVSNNALYHNDVVVDTVSLHEALTAFLSFLQQFGHPLLAGHNISSYDCPVLIHALRQCKMVGALNKAVAGCLDTLQVARMKLPKNKSYKQESLVETLLGKTYEAHNAIADVKILQELYEKCLKLSQDELSSHVFAFLSVQHKGTLDKLVSTSVISKQTQSKLARSGLGLMCSRCFIRGTKRMA